MDPIRFAISNPVKVTVGVILVVLVGLVALSAIPVQLTPDVSPAVITVKTDWRGKSPDEIEKDVIEPQEDVLKNIGGLRRMVATAYRGEGEIELEFNLGVSVQDARVEVSDAFVKWRSIPRVWTSQ